MVDFEKMKFLYNLIKAGSMSKAEGDNFKIYDMKNGTIRIDIKEDKKDE